MRYLNHHRLSIILSLVCVAGGLLLVGRALSVAPPPTISITTASLPDGTIGSAYSQFNAAISTDASDTLTWSIASGTLPDNASGTTTSTSFLTPPTSVTFFFRPTGIDRFIAHAQSSADQIQLPDANNPIVAQIFGPDGKLTNLQPITVVTGGNLRVTLPNSGRSFVPGGYLMKLFIWKNSVVYQTQSNFTWGVLAVNFNKSIYALNDTAKIGMGVLTDQGHTVCDADIEMTIVSPTGRTYAFSTANGTIAKNTSCGPNTVTNNPDYSAELNAGEIGTYAVSMTTRISVGPARTVTDSFQVQNPPAFDVERIGPTRIYPPATYEMSLVIKANQNFEGQVVESMPASFQTTPESFASKTFTADTQTLTWNVAMKAGDTKTLTYIFQTPPPSPELYKLGPLQIGSWQEARQWQIAADANWYSSSWLYREAITIDHTKVASSTGTEGYTNFPVLVTMTSTNLEYTSFTGGHMGNATGSDILFTKSDGTTKINHEIESYTSSTGNLVAWVQLPSVSTSSDTVFYMYYGDAGAANQQNVTSTWDSNYKGVWHLKETGTPQAAVVDSTSNAITSTSNSAVATTSGQVDGASSFNGSSQVINFGNKTNFDGLTALTVEAWVYENSLTGEQRVFDRGDSAHPNRILFYKAATSNKMDLIINNSDGVTASSAMSTTTWTHVVATWVANTTNGMKIYINGGTPAQANSAQTSVGTGATLLRFGQGTYDNVEWWNGRIDEVRISNSVRSADWIKTEYNNQSSPSTFYTSGSEITLPTVSAVTVNGSVTPIILSPGTTTPVTVSYTVTENPGSCTNIFTSGNTTTTLYRAGVGASCAANNLNCYIVGPASTVNDCSGGTVAHATATVNVYYFAQSTGVASSSFPSDNWLANVQAIDGTDNTTGSANSSAVNVGVLLAINVTTSSINYGTITASSTSGSANQTTTVQNAGNSSTTLQLSGTALAKGTNTIATSSQHYATSSFTYGTGDTALSDTATTISGFLLAVPTSTVSVQSNIFWGIGVPAGSPTGTYNGVNLFTAVQQ
jgi:hypothetical protein